MSARSSAAVSPGAPAGMSIASVQPSSGNDSIPRPAGPSRFSEARYIGTPCARSISSRQRSEPLLAVAGRRTGTGSGRGARTAGSSRRRASSGNSAASGGSGSSRAPARAAQPVQAVEGAHARRPKQPRGQPRYEARAWRREAERARPGGLVAFARARHDRAAEATATGHQVEPGDRVAVRASPASSSSACSSVSSLSTSASAQGRRSTIVAQRRSGDRPRSGPCRRASRRTAPAPPPGRPRSRHRRAYTAESS